MKPVLVVGFVLVASAAHGQTIEVTPFASVGYTTTAGVDTKARGVQDLAVAGGFSWGAQGAFLVSDRISMDLFWTQQRTDLRLATSSGTASLFDMNVNLFHFSVVYHVTPRGAGLQPFVFTGLGPAIFTADDLPRETKLSVNVGGGLKWFPREHIGVRVQARLALIRLAGSSSVYCAPFGFCQEWLNQFDVATGLVLRF